MFKKELHKYNAVMKTRYKNAISKDTKNTRPSTSLAKSAKMRKSTELLRKKESEQNSPKEKSEIVSNNSSYNGIL